MKTWNNVNSSYCKHSYIYKKWQLARLNLEKTIFKPKKWNYLFHKWSLVTFKELKKNSAAGKAKEAQTVVDREGIDKQDFVQ